MKSRTSRRQILMVHPDVEDHLCLALPERWTQSRIPDIRIVKVFKPEELDIDAAVEAIYRLLLQPSPEPPGGACTDLRRPVEASEVGPTRAGPVDLLSER